MGGEATDRSDDERRVSMGTGSGADMTVVPDMPRLGQMFHTMRSDHTNIVRAEGTTRRSFGAQ
jgi:hypothetical protein